MATKAKVPARMMPGSLRDDLNTLLDYNWADEQGDYEDRERDGDDNTNHIFLILQRLEKWNRGKGF